MPHGSVATSTSVRVDHSVGPSISSKSAMASARTERRLLRPCLARAGQRAQGPLRHALAVPAVLQAYAKAVRPHTILFPSRAGGGPLSPRSIYRVFMRAKTRARIRKHVYP